MVRVVRIFLSSPGDVATERAQARELLLALARGPFVRGRVLIDVVSWDDPHAPAAMDARFTPQEAVNHGLPTPAQCDLTVVLLWGRMGTPLADRKADGTQYLSGTEWELENALLADKPVLIYRRSEKVLLDPDDPQFADRLTQKRRVDDLFKSFVGPDGSMRRAWSTYSSPADLLVRLEQNVEQFLSELLGVTDTNGRRRAAADSVPPALPHQPQAGPAVADDAGVRPFPDDQAGGWATVEDQTVHFFLADAGFDETTGAAVFACVVVEDVDLLERRWRGAVESMLEDPELQGVPALADAVRRQRFEYRDADPDVRSRVAKTLQALTFEAYVGFTRQDASAGVTRDDAYARIVHAIAFDRLRRHRARAIDISLASDNERRRTSAQSVMASSADEVRRQHPAATGLRPRMVTPAWKAAGGIVAGYVAEIVRERLNHGVAARAFDLVHPNKVRLLFDLDSGHYYSRTDPFTG